MELFFIDRTNCSQILSVLPHIFYFQARNIRNKPVVNRDVQSIRMEEMQNEIQVITLK